VTGIAAGTIPGLLLAYGIGGFIGNLAAGRLADPGARPGLLPVNTVVPDYPEQILMDMRAARRGPLMNPSVAAFVRRLDSVVNGNRDRFSRFGGREELFDALAGTYTRDGLLGIGAEAIRLSYYLATIRRDVPLDYTPGAFAREAKDEEAVRRLFEDLEFRTLLSRVLGPARPVTPKPQPEPMGDLFAQLEEREEVEMPEVSALPKLSIEVLDRSSLPAFVARALEAKTLALDTETTGIDPLSVEGIICSTSTSASPAILTTSSNSSCAPLIPA